MSVDLKNKAISVEVFKYFFDYLNSKKVPKKRKVNNYSLENDITLVPSDIGAIPNSDGSVNLSHIKNQGSSNAGKFLSIDTDGFVVLEDMGYVDDKIDKVSAEVSNIRTKVDGMLVSTMVTLLSSNWEDNIQTVLVDGVTSDPTDTDVFASPATDDTNYLAYTENNVRLYVQMDNAVQFKCDSTPPIDLNINLMIKK